MLKYHYKRCKMKDDDVRRLENQLNKDVTIDPYASVCRFCNKNYFNRGNLRRHDVVCKSKREYKNALLKENDATTTIDWNDRRGMMELLERIVPLNSIKHYTRTGNVAVSLGDIARKYYEHNDSVRCTNLKSNTVRCRENGRFISRDADYVNTHNIEPIIHRVQDASDGGVMVPNIDEYNRLDKITRKDANALTRDDRVFLRKVLDEQKRATHRTTAHYDIKK